MKKQTIKELLREGDKLVGQEVDVKGWVRTRRGNKNVQFVALNDGSTINNIQIVFDLSKFPEEELKPITTGSSLHVKGKLVASQGSGQNVEVWPMNMRFMVRHRLIIRCKRRAIPWNFFERRLI